MMVAMQVPRMHRPRTSSGDTVDMVVEDDELVLEGEGEGDVRSNMGLTLS